MLSSIAPKFYELSAADRVTQGLWLPFERTPVENTEDAIVWHRRLIIRKLSRDFLTEEIRRGVAEIKPVIPQPYAEQYREYQEFLDKQDLSRRIRVKLARMMHPRNFLEALSTAEDTDTKFKAPADAYERTMDSLMDTEQDLHIIGQEAKEPVILVVSDNAFKEKLRAMNDHKCYTSPLGSQQQDAGVEKEVSRRLNLQAAQQKRIVVTDGAPAPRMIPGSNIREMAEQLSARYAALCMRHIDLDEMAVLLQLSLRAAHVTNDTGVIVSTGISKGGDRGADTLIDPVKNPPFKTRLDPTDHYTVGGFFGGGIYFDTLDGEDEAHDMGGRATKTLVEL